MPAPAINVLVIRRRYLGDLVLLGALFRNLCLHWPQARLTALVESQYAEVLALNPDVDAVIALPAKGAGLQAWWRFGRTLRRARFSHVLDLDNRTRTAWISRVTGAPLRAALFHETPPRWPRLYTHLAIDPPEAHERRPIAEYYLQVLPVIGVPVVTREIRLVPREADLAAVRELIAAKLKTQNSKPKTLLVHPGSRSPYRLWPAERFAEVCDRVQTELGLRVLLVGGPAEAALLAAIRRHARQPLTVIDEPLGIGRLAALAHLCGALLCHDSGPMHVAAAVGTPVVALFGSQNVALWRPAGDHHLILQALTPCGAACIAPGECVPEDSYRSYCVRRLSVEEVFVAVRRQFTAVTPATHA